MPFSAMQLYEIGRVFDPGIDPALYHPSAAAELLLPRLLASLPAAGSLTALTGESGAGKSLLVAVALRRLPGEWAHVATLHFSTMGADELLRAIVHALNIRLGAADVGQAAGVFNSLQDDILAEMARRVQRGERSLLVVDDAHGLPLDALRLLHRLSRVRPEGEPLLRVMLVGSPRLLDHLRQPALSALAADFHPRLVAGAFEAWESRAFVQQRVEQCTGDALPPFTPGSLAALHAHAHGLPGRLQLLCREVLHQALLAEDAAPISAERVAEVAQPLGFVPLLPKPAVVERAKVGAAPAPGEAKRRWPVLLLAGLLLTGLAAAIFVRVPTTTPRAAVLPPPKSAAQPEPPSTAMPIPEPTSVPVPAQTAGVASEPSAPAARPIATAASTSTPRHNAPPVTVAQAAGPASRECSALLTQISLGEPLSSKQKRTLESLCR